jgi:hypothetical protein
VKRDPLLHFACFEQMDMSLRVTAVEETKYPTWVNSEAPGEVWAYIDSRRVPCSATVVWNRNYFRRVVETYLLENKKELPVKLSCAGNHDWESNNEQRNFARTML